MASIGEILKETLSLHVNVENLKSTMQRVEDVLRDLQDRVTRLESTGDVVALKAEKAAIEGSSRVTHELVRQVTTVENNVAALKALVERHPVALPPPRPVASGE